MNDKELKERIKFFIEFMESQNFDCEIVNSYKIEFRKEINHKIHDLCLGLHKREERLIFIKIRELNKMTKTLFHELCHSIDIDRNPSEMEDFAEKFAQKIYMRFINQ